MNNNIDTTPRSGGYSTETFTVSSKGSELSLKISYKTTADVSRICGYTLKKDDKVLYTSKDASWYLSLWTPFIDLCMKTGTVKRVLIVGGGDQLLSNYLLHKYPVNITLVDPDCYLYLNEKFRRILKLKDFVNEEDRKLVLIDMTLKEAYEDQVLSDEEFDLILVDNFKDSLYHKTRMYEKEIADLYFKLLKPQSSLIINHDFSIRKYNPTVRATYDLLDLHVTKVDVAYYKNYLAYMNELFCETDYTYQKDIKIHLYTKVPNVIEQAE